MTSYCDVSKHITYYEYDAIGRVARIRDQRLTDEQRDDSYLATMETAYEGVEGSLFTNVHDTKTSLPSGAPTEYTTPDDYASKLDGSTHKIGPALALKVMAGDHFNLCVSDYYTMGTTTPTTPNPIVDLAGILANSIGIISGSKASVHELSTNDPFTAGITSFFDSQNPNTDKPQAFINWILFDEHFNYVGESSGREQVGDDNHLNIHQFNGIPITRNGYLYIYVSNETSNVDVYFDNLYVRHIHGPLLEESHYYPFGLEMEGISSKALAFGSPKNTKKFSGQELESGYDINLYQFKFRNEDCKSSA